MSRMTIRAEDGRANKLVASSALVAALMLALLASACSTTGHNNRQAGAATHSKAASEAKTATQTSAATRAEAAAKAKAAMIASHLKITPSNGAADANPSAGITVTAADGTLKSVTVHTSGDAVSGSLSPTGTVWHSRWALDVSQTYTVTATASLIGLGTVTSTSTFRTLTPSNTFQTEILEGYNQTYGVGMPIILYFSQTITNKAAVEQALQISTSKPVVGSWFWDDPCNMAASCVYFRPRDYWPSGTTVSFVGHLNGVEGAPGLYGTHTLTQTFEIGPSLVAIGNTQTHMTQIYYNGQLMYNWPISSGRPGDDTPDGSYLTIEKENPVQMVGPGYSISVPWSVRFTFSGDYYHDAYWSVGEQGFENVSHGCVNLSPADAELYYNLAVPGDPITIVGSPKAGSWDNGWTEWFLSWPQYLQGSALHEAVEAGPSGSVFVNPASLPPSHAVAPLETAPVNNATVQ
jgi:lipoprotein-anchoring transpeptidase ErfK/SrfK